MQAKFYFLEIYFLLLKKAGGRRKVSGTIAGGSRVSGGSADDEGLVAGMEDKSEGALVRICQGCTYIRPVCACLLAA